MERYEIAVTVFVIADGVDCRDAGDVAVQGVEDALAAPGDPISVRTPGVVEKTVRVAGVMETGTAAVTGYLSVRPTFRAYPNRRADGTEDVAIEARSPGD